MKAAVLYQARAPLRIEDLEMPEVHEEDVLIRVASCGVCHTDLKVMEGRSRFTPPTILGHEVAGTVAQVGARCGDFRIGNRVITATIIGGLGHGPFTISSGNFVTREITITGVSSRQANDVEEVFQMATAGRIELKSLVTKSYRYDQINEALDDLQRGKLRMGVSLWN